MKIILIVIAGVVAVIGLIKKDSWPLWATLSVSGLLLIGAIFQVAVERREAKEAAKLKYAGTLENRSRVLLSTRENLVPKIELGNGGVIFGFKENPSSIIFFDDNRIKIIIDDGQVKVSTIIRNNAGTAVAELINNEWKVNKDNSFDRNYAKDALEVKDNTGDIVLQVKVLYDRIQFQGKFYDGNGHGVALGEAESGKGGIIEKTGTAHPKLLLKIKAIFQYPSDNHLGKFRDTIK